MITLEQTPFLFQALFRTQAFVSHLQRNPKSSRIPPAQNLIPKFNDICETPSNIALWCLLLSSLSYFLEKPPRGGKRQQSSLSAIINNSGWCH